MRKCVCFAYFGDDTWIGWYGDSFGSVIKHGPKIYGHSLEQIAIIKKNFTDKMEALNEKSDLGSKISNLSFIDVGLNSDKEKLKKYKKVELKMVECPYYSGPNPDYDEKAAGDLAEARREAMTKEGILGFPGGSIERIEAIRLFDNLHPEFKYPINSWKEPDYETIKEWASTEPTEFLNVFTYDN